MSTYKALFSYDGSAYEGWQIQPHTEATIQGQINKALRKIVKTDDIKTQGSGRTDAGVHALAQVCKIAIPISIDSSALVKAINSHLPRDIRCMSVEVVDDSFHPVRDALWKSYDYLVYTGDILNPLLNGRVTPFRYELDHAEMHNTLQVITGERDFKNFSTKGTEVSTTVRTIHCAELIGPTASSFASVALDSSFLHFRFTGSGFLKQMVRLLVSAVLESGRGKISSSEVESFFAKHTDLKIAPTAKPDGLYLSHVEYDSAWRPTR